MTSTHRFNWKGNCARNVSNYRRLTTYPYWPKSQQEKVTSPVLFQAQVFTVNE